MEERLRRTAAKLARSEAKTLDRVFMHDLVLDVEIGVYTHEKGVTQRVRFSVDVDVLPATRRARRRYRPRLRLRHHHQRHQGASSPAAISIWSRPWPRRWRAIASPIPARLAVKVTIEKLDKEPGAVGVEIVRAKGSA